MSNDAITTLAPQAIVKPVTKQRAIIMKEALEEDAEQRQLLAAYVKSHMIEGVDYGVIPGTKKRTLLKPGAEKLTDLFRCTASFRLVEKIEDWEGGFFHYLFRARISYRETGAILAEGFGSANAKEGRYRWRNAQLSCPECGSEALLRSKNAPEFFCWAKRGGCGSTFPVDDKRISSQKPGKVENDDIYTLANTILKMAKKRALVDGAIALARCSDLFSQDLEDLGELAHVVEQSAQPEPTPAKGSRTASIKAAVSARVVKVQPVESEPPPPSEEFEPAPAQEVVDQIWPKQDLAKQLSDSVLVPYGKSKGQPLSAVTPKDLLWLLDTARENVAKEDPKWHAKNQKWLDAVDAELARRKIKL